MIRTVPQELGWEDARQFSLIDYRHGHSYAVIRGFPELDEDADDEDAVALPVVRDLFFAGVTRLSCWKDLGRIALRLPDEQEGERLRERWDRPLIDDRVYLLRSGSIEEYVIASRVYWADYQIGGGALSPLAANDAEYRERFPPVDGMVFYQ